MGSTLTDQRLGPGAPVKVWHVKNRGGKEHAPDVMENQRNLRAWILTRIQQSRLETAELAVT
jgi:hypothetical protein